MDIEEIRYIFCEKSGKYNNDDKRAIEEIAEMYNVEKINIYEIIKDLLLTNTK